MSIFMNVFALVMMVLILVFFIFNRNLIVKINKLYLLLNFIIVLGIVFDILLLYFSRTNRDFVGTFKFTAKIYLILLTCDSYVLSIYSANILYDKKKNNFHKVLLISSVIFLIALILILCLPLGLETDINGQRYIIGSALYVSYSFSFVFMILSSVLLILNRHLINKRKILAIVIYISLWTFVTGLQIILNFVETNGQAIYFGRLASTIGNLSIFALIENPQNDTESEFGILNDTAFRKYVENNLDNDYIILNVDKKHFKSYDDIKELLRSILLISDHKNKVFKYEPYTYIFVEKRKNSDELRNTIINKIDHHVKKNNFIHFHITVLPQYIFIESPAKLVNYIDTIISKVTYDNYMTLLTENDIRIIEEYIEISNEINFAIKNDMILVNYQGIVDTKNDKFVSAEALVRLKDKRGNIIPPSKFIPIVEEDGRIVELSDKIFEHVCIFIKHNNLDDLGLKYIEFNLSAKQFNDYKLVSKYVDIVKKYNVNPKYINFEITETATSDTKKVVQIMNEFKQYGFTFSLDDFGTGNSNLNYIIDMPVDIVKFDKTMVDAYFNNKFAKIVIDESIDIVKKLNRKIVFEGIETKEEVETVKNLGVDFIQGYYYAKPLAEEEFLKLLAQNK